MQQKYQVSTAEASQIHRIKTATEIHMSIADPKAAKTQTLKNRGNWACDIL